MCVPVKFSEYIFSTAFVVLQFDHYFTCSRILRHEEAANNLDNQNARVI